MITANLKTLTPAEAKELLERGGKYQRNINASRAKRMAEAMTEGRFPVTGQTIVIDWNGHLLDGQHRLLAQVTANMSMTYVVVENEDPARFEFYDIGTRRTAAQFVASRHRADMVGAAQLIMEYRARGSRMRALSGGTASFPMSEVLAAVEQMPGLEQLAGEAKLVYAATRINTTSLLAVTYLGGTKAPDLIDPWFTGLLTGADLGVKDPRLAVRNAWSRNYRTLNVRPSLQMRWAYLVRAWNAFAADEPLLVLRYQPDAPLPLIVGTEPEFSATLPEIGKAS
jgi:hypothetical protein